MKILKPILFIILGIILVAVILVLIAPNDYQIRESRVIDAPKGMIFRHISNLKKHNEWNPWNDYDTAQIVTFSEGEDATPGFRYSWVGPINGKGYMELESIAENQVDIDLVFTEPFQSESDITMELEEVDGGVNVIWTLDGSMPAPMNAVMLFSDMGMSTDFQKGLENLETMVLELKNNPVYNGYNVNAVDIPTTRLLGVRKNVKMENMQEFIANSYGSLMGKLSNYEFSSPSCLYYTWDEESGETDMVAAMITNESTPKLVFEEMIFEGPAIQVDYYGDYENMQDPHWAIDLYMSDFGITPKMPVWEEYVTDPGSEPDTSKWLTKITYFTE